LAIRWHILAAFVQRDDVIEFGCCFDAIVEEARYAEGMKGEVIGADALQAWACDALYAA